MTRRSSCDWPNNPIERVAKVINDHSISVLLVLDESQEIIGTINSDGVSRVVSACDDSGSI